MSFRAINMEYKNSFITTRYWKITNIALKLRKAPMKALEALQSPAEGLFMC